MTQLTDSAPSPKLPTHVAFFPGTEYRVEFSAADGWEPVDALVKAHPGLGIPKIEACSPIFEPAVHSMVEGSDLTPKVIAPVIEVVPAEEPPVLDRAALGSHPAVVTEESARDRVEGQRAALVAAGVNIRADRGHFGPVGATGAVSSRHQSRAREHEQKLPLREAAEQLRECIRSERREDVEVTARALSTKVHSNGKLTIDGMTLQEQAIRGILSRCDSPAQAFIFGMRDRMAANIAAFRAAEAAGDHPRTSSLRALIDADKRRLAGTLAHELWMAGDVALKLRTRTIDGQKDIFAGVSPRYAPADAPEIVDRLIDALPAEAKGSWSYDPATTTWELRAEVWTPTPVAEHAVGEPFRGYVSFRSRDNGTGTLNGGGGIEILSCLNSATYVADGVDVSRRHIGAIVAEAEGMIAKARRSIDALCEAWGAARQDVIIDSDGTWIQGPEEMQGIPISKALPGFWFGELTSKRSELAGVLRGSTKGHVAGLVDAYHSERRNHDQLVKADFAQAWTRYIQGQPAQVRRDGEAAIASWMVSGRPVRFDAERVGA
jgi:hypothetical protein